MIITERMLHAFIGRAVVIGGQEFMLVGFDNDQAVFENEDERIVRISFNETARLLRGCHSEGAAV